MPRPSLIYAQSGGVTAVINVTAAAVIQAGRAAGWRVLAARDGILGVLGEQLIDTSRESAKSIRLLAQTPGGAFGSCRFKLAQPDAAPDQYDRLFEVFAAHNVRAVLYNGGNDSADTSLRIAAEARKRGVELSCIGVPKTIDNDLAGTDCCPGFGSAAKYLATSIFEGSLDVAAMASSSTKVFIMEVMGRHAGWLAAATGLVARAPGDGPQIILFPEVPFDEARFLKKVRDTVERDGFCSVVVSEGLRDSDGRFVAEVGGRDAFGHSQLGGVGAAIGALVQSKLGYKQHSAVPDYLQRSARHLASATDAEQAAAVGRAAVELAVAGETGVMPVIERLADSPYRWRIVTRPLEGIANREKKMPRAFISRDGFAITAACRRYLLPLVAGLAPTEPGSDGLPQAAGLKRQLVATKLPPYVID